MSTHERASVTAFIALGANLGDREGNLQQAIQALRETRGIEVSGVSQFVENPAVGMPEGSPDFLNAAVKVQTTLSAHALLKRLHEIEDTLGRERNEKWLSRPIDLDLLLYGNKVLSSDSLVVPHPLMHERRFVLEPLAEIAPEMVHPTLQMTVQGLLDDLNAPHSKAI